MTLNSSGPISLGGPTAGQSIAVELSLGATTTISLNQANVRGLAGVASGAIIMPTNFYGKANTYTIDYVVLAGGGTNDQAFGGAGGMQTSSATVGPGTSSPAVVGVAGGGPNIYGYGTNGSDSTFRGLTSTGGGGGGGGGGCSCSSPPGSPGGCGGGGSYDNATHPGGTGSQGGNGGTGRCQPGVGCFNGGGGGMGGSAPDSSAGGRQLPGPGLTWSPNGVVYARGAGNGGGSTFGSGNVNGAVIVSYISATQKGSGGTVTSSGGRYFHTFTSSGTYVS